MILRDANRIILDGKEAVRATLNGQVVWTAEQPPIVNENLFAEPNNFELSFWSKTTTSVSTDGTLAPDGVSLARRLQSSGTFPRIIRFHSIQPGQWYTLSAFVRAGNAYIVGNSPYTTDGTTLGELFNLNNGTATSDRDGVARIEQSVNGWFRISVSFLNDSSGSAEMRPVSHAQGNTGGWTGSGSYVYAWGAKLEIGDVPTGTLYT